MSPDRLAKRIRDHQFKDGGPYLVRVEDTHSMSTLVRAVFFSLAGQSANVVMEQFVRDCSTLGLNPAINRLKMASAFNLGGFWECPFTDWMEDSLRTYFTEAIGGHGPFPYLQGIESKRN